MTSAVDQVQVCVPIAAGGSGAERDRLHKWCLQAWRQQIDRQGWTMCFATDIVRTAPTTTDRFNHAKAINRAVGGINHGRPDDVLVIADADTFPWPSLRERIEAARHGRWSAPARYVNLSQRATDDIVYQTTTFAEAAETAQWYTDHEWEGDTSWAGIVVTRRDHFHHAGGYDERFDGWSADDIAFAMAMQTMNRPVTRMGTAYHLHHDAPRSRTYDRPGFSESWQLTQRYMDACWDKPAMKALVDEWRSM